MDHMIHYLLTRCTPNVQLVRLQNSSTAYFSSFYEFSPEKCSESSIRSTAVKGPSSISIALGKSLPFYAKSKTVNMPKQGAAQLSFLSHRRKSRIGGYLQVVASKTVCFVERNIRPEIRLIYIMTTFGHTLDGWFALHWIVNIRHLGCRDNRSNVLCS